MNKSFSSLLILAVTLESAVTIASAFTPQQDTTKQVARQTPTLQTDPWTADQLMAPADLAARIEHPSGPQPLIICVGPSGSIKGSVETGPANKKENLEKLKALLSKTDLQREVIIYCGCCPFEHCPNVRPAFALLTAMHFTHPRLLNLSHNIKTDWIDHGYPVNDSK